MVSKTDDIPASVPDCNPVDLADEAGDGAQDIKETSKTGLKDSCGSGENLKLLSQTPTRLRLGLHLISSVNASVQFCKRSIPV